LNTEQLIELLLDPDSYPHAVDVITTIETHISIVFLTGSFAYKLKKPVDFGFLDFSTLEQRKKFCSLEVQLNRRTAPQLYEGVYQIESLNTPEPAISINPQDDTAANVVDYLVKMKQFDPNDVLGRMLQNQGVIDNAMLEKLAQQIARFHKIAEPVEQDSRFGEPKTLLQPMLDNLPTLYSFFTDAAIKEQVNTIEQWTHQTFEQVTPLLIARKQQGFIRACHGDLHLDNIALIDDDPLLFDGIEFNNDFRWIDVISDLAFLLIDLDFRKHKPASLKVLSLYLSKTLDYNSLFLLNFYRVYRTMVRAKITTLRGMQLEDNSLQQQHVIQIAKDYISQAANYLAPKRPPKCILLQGISGSGKSHLAGQMLEELDLNAIVLSSDRIRKTLFGIDANDRVDATLTSSLYSAEMNRKTYGALEQNAATILANGFDVIVDATFLKAEHRQRFYQLAAEPKIECYLISIEASLEQASQSILDRQLLNDNPSDADIEVMHRQQQYLEPPTECEDALVLSASDLRINFPKSQLQDFLKLPITDL